MREKELLREIENLKFENESLKRDKKELEDFIKRNNIVCPKCGQSGLDCHNYQG